MSVVAAESECVHDREADDVAVRVVLSNDGEDDRTVRVTPDLDEEEGDERQSELESFEVSVPGAGRADGTATIDAAPDDLVRCSVRVDGGEPVELELR